MPASSSWATGLCGTVNTITGTLSPASLICSTSWRPLTRPCSNASTRTTSGRSCWICGSTFEPSVITSRSFTLDCEFSSPRMYCATWGTSSTSRRRVWSVDAIGPSVPRRSGRSGRPDVPPTDTGGQVTVAARDRSSGVAAHDDRAVAAGPQRPEVVVARHGLDLETGIAREVAKLVGRHETQRVAPDPAGRGLAIAALLEDRAEGDDAGRGVMLRGRDLRHPPAVLGILPDVLEDHPAIEPPQVVRVGQPHVGDGESAARQMGCHRPERLALRVAAREQEQRVQGDERERERAGRCETQVEEVRL